MEGTKMKERGKERDERIEGRVAEGQRKKDTAFDLDGGVKDEIQIQLGKNKRYKSKEIERLRYGYRVWFW